MDNNMSRRFFIKSVFGLASLSMLSIYSADVLARRGGGRVSMGSGLASGSRYSGPILSQEQLKQCVLQERFINAASKDLDQKEIELSRKGSQVDNYSQYSVDNYNRLVNDFNNDGERLNAKVDAFNQSCANHAYYESDMQKVLGSIGK